MYCRHYFVFVSGMEACLAAVRAEGTGIIKPETRLLPPHYFDIAGDVQEAENICGRVKYLGVFCMTKRVAVTGIGVISPLGNGREALWEGLQAGRSAIGEVTSFDTKEFTTRIAAEVQDFQPGEYLDRKEARRMDRFAQFAVAAARMALEDAHLELKEGDREQIGVINGSGIGGMSTFEKQCSRLVKRGPNRVSPFFIPMMISNMGAGQIAIQLDLRGPNFTTVSACAAGSHAIGSALRLIQHGDADVMVAGGSEATITPLSFAGFCAMKAMSTQNENPAEASRPFDKQRDGFVMGEGGGFVVLEDLKKAEKRGARIYAELAGFGMTSDAHHITAPDPEGHGAIRAMVSALEDAGVAPLDVDYINAHGTSTPLNDEIETMAIKKVFGRHAADLSVSSTKSMIGHLLGAAGGVELIATILTMKEGIIPPTINYQTPDPACDLDYVPNHAREEKVDVAISNSFGFGGHNATLVLKSYK